MAASSATNIRIAPVNVTWEIEQQYTIKTVTDTSGSLDGLYFVLSDSDGGVAFWIDVDDSGTLIPAGASAEPRAVEITTIATGDVAATVATNVAAAIDADSKFSATASGDVVTVTASAAADIADWADGDTTFTFTKCQEGGSLDLGLLDGDVEVSPTEEIFPVVSHQTGVTETAALRQGNNAEITTVLQETQSSKLKEFYGKATGGTFTPSGGTELFGQGSSRIGTNVLIEARRLKLAPVTPVESESKETLTFWKAYPLPDSITYSGENPRLLNVTWRVFNDSARDSAISLFAFGDSAQTGI